MDNGIICTVFKRPPSYHARAILNLESSWTKILTERLLTMSNWILHSKVRKTLCLNVYATINLIIRGS